MTDQSIGVLCAWFNDHDAESSLEFHLKKQLSDHMYIPVSYYICTLTRKCFEIISSTGFASGGISSFESTNQEMVTTNGIKLTTGCQAFILELLQNGGTDKRDN